MEQKYCQSAVAVFTFLFAVTWQFNQFALLLQAMALYAVQVLHLVQHRKVFSCQLTMLSLHLSALMCVCVWQCVFIVCTSDGSIVFSIVHCYQDNSWTAALSTNVYLDKLLNPIEYHDSWGIKVISQRSRSHGFSCASNVPSSEEPCNDLCLPKLQIKRIRLVALVAVVFH